MGFEHLADVPLEKAREDYLKALLKSGMSAKTEKIPVAEASGRVTGAPVYAKVCAPGYNTCAADGVALDARLTFGATEKSPVFLARGQYAVVATGDPLPPKLDAVIMAENIEEAGGGIKLCAPVSPWQHIRQVGEDICTGEMILPSYSVISPSALGAMIAGGIMDVTVVARPIVGIIPTGDKLVSLGENPTDGEVVECGSIIFSSMLRQWGARPVIYDIVRNNLGEITRALISALSCCDAVIVCAGSSVGAEDYSARAIAGAGKVLYHGVAIKPGRPTILGLCEGKPILGVPGYPVSGIVAIEALLRPVIERLAGRAPAEPEYAQAILSKQLVSAQGYREYIRVCLGYVTERLIAIPLGRGSGIVSSFAKADGIVEIPPEIDGYPRGARVSARLLRPLPEIKNTLVAIGSHDPLLDELSEFMRRLGRGLSMRSSHVGSMGGIMAARRGEAHIAGIHLLDEATSEYNVSFIEKYFPNGGVTVVECACRKQGLMLAKGNPKNILSVRDIAKDGVRFVNRQKGSGTRLLCDCLLRLSGIDASSVYGYDSEEYTHTSVAALIAAGSADAGLGIYAAAKMYDLDFVHICDEQYDLLIPDSAWDTEVVQTALAILQSDAFAMRLKQLGGYRMDRPGKVRRRFEEL